MMDWNDPKIAKDFQRVINAHNTFMEKHGPEASGDLLIAMCVTFICKICDGDAMTGLAFIADLSDGFMRTLEDDEADEEQEAALQ